MLRPYTNATRISFHSHPTTASGLPAPLRSGAGSGHRRSWRPRTGRSPSAPRRPGPPRRRAGCSAPSALPPDLLVPRRGLVDGALDREGCLLATSVPVLNLEVGRATRPRLLDRVALRGVNPAGEGRARRLGGKRPKGAPQRRAEP